MPGLSCAQCFHDTAIRACGLNRVQAKEGIHGFINTLLCTMTSFSTDLKGH